MTNNALRYIAARIVGEYYGLPPRFVENLRRSVRRNYRLALTKEEATAYAAHYQALYQAAAAALPRFLDPPKGHYVDTRDVRVDEFRAHLAKKYPKEPVGVLNTLLRYVILYEYLK